MDVLTVFRDLEGRRVATGDVVKTVDGRLGSVVWDLGQVLFDGRPLAELMVPEDVACGLSRRHGGGGEWVGVRIRGAERDHPVVDPHDDSDLLTRALEDCDHDDLLAELLSTMSTSDVRDAIERQYEPDDLFSDSDLREWVEENLDVVDVDDIADYCRRNKDVDDIFDADEITDHVASNYYADDVFDDDQLVRGLRNRGLEPDDVFSRQELEEAVG